MFCMTRSTMVNGKRDRLGEETSFKTGKTVVVGGKGVVFNMITTYKVKNNNHKMTNTRKALYGKKN
jgi:hypothetical protein